MRPFWLLSCLLSLTLSSLPAMSQRPGGGGARTPGRSTEPMGAPPEAGNLPTFTSPYHADDEAKVEFHSETNLVQVSVVVVDKTGHHVHGLTQDNFHIFENGKEQKITSFEDLTPARSPVVVATKPGIFTNLVLDRDKPHSITVIALDAVNTPFLDQGYARRELIKYLANNMDTGQTMALVLITSKGLKIVSGLTSSVESLQQALKKVSSEISALHNVDEDAAADDFTGDTSSLVSAFSAATAEAAVSEWLVQGDLNYAHFKQEAAIETTMDAFLDIAWSLAGIPGRKTLIWATGGFPFLMDSPSAVPGGRLSMLYERAMQVLNDAQVSVYPIDAQGLVTMGPGANVGRPPKGPAALQQLSNRSWLMNARQDTLKDFAEMTGGRAFYNTNDLTSAFQRATDDASSYYMVGYYLDTKNNKAGWRQLKVKVDGKDLEARARKGFFVTNATINPETSRVADMNFAIAAPFQATGIPLVMQWGTIKDLPANKGKKQIPFMLRVVGTDIRVEGTHSAMNVAIAAIATKSASKKSESAIVADKVSEDVKGNLTPENVASLRSRGILYNNTLELAPGQYSVRFVVRDNLSGRLGSMSVPVTVN
jgi:VWFA-related protein